MTACAIRNGSRANGGRFPHPVRAQTTLRPRKRQAPRPDEPKAIPTPQMSRPGRAGEFGRSPSPLLREDFATVAVRTPLQSPMHRIGRSARRGDVDLLRSQHQYFAQLGFERTVIARGTRLEAL